MSLSSTVGMGGGVGGLRAELGRRLDRGERFAALFGRGGPADATLIVLVAGDGDVGALVSRLPPGQAHYPSLTPGVPAAFWYERIVHDMVGLVPDGHPRLDPLVLPHSEGAPLPGLGLAGGPARIDPDESALTRHVHGPGMFTIPHGPVRSGVFESVEYLVETPGEDIPHLRIRVHHKHRGVQKRFEGLDPEDGVLLAERVEGIASVAHALGFAHAVERLAQVSVPQAGALVRVLHAELERIANHLDVMIKLADAAGLAVATARFGWHKERTLRLIGALCGSRFGRGVVVPGGVSALPRLDAEATREQLGRLRRGVVPDMAALLGSSSFLDRVRAAGPLDAALAARHGALGPVGRGSGAGPDCRVTRPYDAYATLGPDAPRVRDDGDAQARLQVRVDEVEGSFDLIADAVDALDAMPGGDGDPAVRRPIDPQTTGTGLGWAEAPQGEVLYLVELDDGRVGFCAPRSASLHNLSLFPATFQGDILTDFPFIEASFGLSIAGVVM